MSLSPISRYRYVPHSHLHGFVQALVPGSSINAMVKRYLRCFRCCRQLADATTQLLGRSPPPPLVGNPPTDFLFVAKQSMRKESAPSQLYPIRFLFIKSVRRQWRWCVLRRHDGRGVASQYNRTGGIDEIAIEPTMVTYPKLLLTRITMYGPEADGVAIGGRKNDDDDMWEWRGWCGLDG